MSRKRPCLTVSNPAAHDPFWLLGVPVGNDAPILSGRRLSQAGAQYKGSTQRRASGDLIWKTERFELLWIDTGLPRTRATSRPSTRFTERTQCSNIRNPASVSAAG